MGVRAISFFALLALAGITAWRVWRNKGNASYNGFHAAWSAALLALIMSFLTDLNDGLGAAFSAAVMIGLLVTVATGKAPFNLLGSGASSAAPGGKTSPSAGSGGGGPGQGGGPSGPAPAPSQTKPPASSSPFGPNPNYGVD